ncbi:MAG: hypothetical protein OXC68_01710 [Aestuariivita sp.]|nr:hypothetical protein [Aestuariivita sp.]
MAQFKTQKKITAPEKKLRELVKHKRTTEEKRAQRISWCLSITEDPDNPETRKRIEKIVDEISL